MSRVNETRFSVQHESFECKCRLNKSVCNSKDKWNYCNHYWNYWNYCEILVRVKRHLKTNECLNIKNLSCKKHLFGKLVLACEHDI